MASHRRLVVAASVLGMGLLAAAAVVAGHLPKHKDVLHSAATKSAAVAFEPSDDQPEYSADLLPNLLGAGAPDTAQMIVEAVTRAGLDVVGSSTFGETTIGTSSEESENSRDLLLAALRRQEPAIASAPKTWQTWRQLSRQLEESAAMLEGLQSYEQADVLRTAAAQLRRDARAAEGTMLR
jgi:hypothetical protein